ncbi:Leucine-rich repeat, immunoglobulin domain and transmembrane domain-containing 1-like protein [Daphnia magna]|uniref:Leucine-rich repeat, immunoglobulin domain and transmembrane domain-containing 1-like protein n=1 Tax=Daphnia magna TaxID=35525 RepID=A0A162CP34_9CRUS|nr:Leucine-rich repeat, immunoglobulin domain and transmembrane domain-containing 1-like protein [Daphnia magna]
MASSTWDVTIGFKRWSAIWVIWTTLVTAGLVAMSAAGGAGACPGVKWKGGKQTVECRQRGLITLPSNIDPQTQVLDLSGSNLQTLPREAFSRANLLNLQKIYLASCRIGQVDPTALRGLTNLIELDISDNLLTDVPSQALADAVSLRELRLSSNPIQKIEQGAFDQAPGLVKLDLSDCQIETLAAGAFDGLDQLSHLRLGGNRLEELRPDVVSSLPRRLHGLELQNNPWICDCRLRYLREWLQQHNVPSPATAACALPERLSGRALIELLVDDFACPPQVIPFPAAPLLAGGGHPHLHVEASAGENATLTCRMSGVPSPEITWLWRGKPMVNGSIPGEQEALPVGGAAEGTGYPGDESESRTVTILEEGKYEKTSYLILSPARETDSGEFVCVAANPAGLARVNLTLRVDIQAPVVGGLGGAQIAGLGAGLFILLAAVVAILLLMLIRTRSSANSSGSSANKLDDIGKQSGQRPAMSLGQAHQGIQGSSSSGPCVAKSPTLSALEYGQIAFVNPHSPNRVVVVTTPAATASGLSDRPDLIHDARNSSDHYGYDLGPPLDYSTLNRRYHTHGQSADRDILAATSAGDYQSAQTDSFYPSALWDHILNPTSEEETSDGANNNITIDQASSSRSSSGHMGSPIHLPHVPLTVMDRNGMPQIYVPYTSGQVIQNPRDVLAASYADRDSEAGESAVSVDSYSLPRRIPQQHSKESIGGQNFVPYPPDYGLPRTQSPPTLAKPPTQHLAAAGAATIERQPPAPTTEDPSIQQQQQQQQHNSSSSCYGSKANSSAESSPVATSSNTKGARFWQQRPGINNGKRSHHHFARDSPDEGYQENAPLTFEFKYSIGLRLIENWLRKKHVPPAPLEHAEDHDIVSIVERKV